MQNTSSINKKHFIDANDLWDKVIDRPEFKLFQNELSYDVLFEKFGPDVSRTIQKEALAVMLQGGKFYLPEKITLSFVDGTSHYHPIESQLLFEI